LIKTLNKQQKKREQKAKHSMKNINASTLDNSGLGKIYKVSALIYHCESAGNSRH